MYGCTVTKLGTKVRRTQKLVENENYEKCT